MMKVKRTIAYIDGFNLYYGLLRYSSNKWLDLEAFVRALLPRPEEHTFVAVKYFTARVNYDPAEPLARSHQDAYLRALSAFSPDIKIIEGYYRKFRAHLPFAKEPCRSCTKAEFATVWKTEEKRSDVNLATEMMADFIEADFDCAMLVSGDTDLVAPVYYLKKHGKTTLVFNPQERPSEDLRAVSSYYRNIDRAVATRCHLPNEIPVGTHGSFVRCPPEWVRS